MMEELFKEGIVEVNLGAVVILKELSENSLKIKVNQCIQSTPGDSLDIPCF